MLLYPFEKEVDLSAQQVTDIIQVNWGFITTGVEWVPGYTLGIGSQSKESDHLYLFSRGDPDETSGERTWVIEDAIDFTNYNTLKIDWEFTQEVSGNAYVGIWDAQMTRYAISPWLLRVAYADSFARQITSHDISDINEEGYVRVHSRASSIYTDRTATIKVYEVWLEE